MSRWGFYCERSVGLSTGGVEGLGAGRAGPNEQTWEVRALGRTTRVVGRGGRGCPLSARLVAESRLTPARYALARKSSHDVTTRTYVCGTITPRGDTRGAKRALSTRARSGRAGCPDLTPDLAGGVLHGVDVHVGRAGAHVRDQLVEARDPARARL